MITLEKVRQRAESDAINHGYHLNPDLNFLSALLEGLKRNEERYGYPSCPCRLASGKFEFDRDITCPCDYRDLDVEEYGSCYCALYVRRDLFEGKTAILPVKERRPPEKQTRAYGIVAKTDAEKPSEKAAAVPEEYFDVKLVFWYCKQCGYICFREEPPYVCPICKAKRTMFAELKIPIGERE